jgi:hypothetical protein
MVAWGWNRSTAKNEGRKKGRKANLGELLILQWMEKLGLEPRFAYLFVTFPCFQR